MSQKVRYIGGADSRTLSEDDMAALGVEHPGLWWPKGVTVIEVEDDEIAEILTTQLKSQFKAEASTEETVEELTEKTRDDLVAEAEALGLQVKSKATKEEIAELIVVEQDRLASAPAGDASADLEPTA